MEPVRRIHPLFLLGASAFVAPLAVGFVLPLLGWSWARYAERVLLIHAPLSLGGALLMLGALPRRRGRVSFALATIGLAIALFAAGGLAAIWISLDQSIIGWIFVGYALLHGAAIFRLWRGDYDEDAARPNLAQH